MDRIRERTSAVRLHVALLAIMAVFAAAESALAADYYVRTGGSDSCNGQTDADGSSGSCAFATINRCIAAAGCGDTCHVRAGEYFGDRVNLTRNCTAANPWRLIGDGPNQVIWHVGQRKVNSCSPVSGKPNVYRCPRPSGGLSTNNTGRSHCFTQKVATKVPMADENGVSGDLREYVCMTLHTSQASVETTPGAYTVAGADYIVRPWADETPITQAPLYASTDNAASAVESLRMNGSSNEVSGLTLISGHVWSISDGGNDNTYSNMRVFGGEFWVQGTSNGVTLDNVTVANNLRRPFGGSGTTGTAWDTNSQSIVVKGSDFTLRNVEAYAAREGVGFSGNAGPGTVDGLKVHWHHNHNYKWIDNVHDVTATNVWSYNSQESMFVGNCVTNVAHRHSTFVASVLIHDNHEGACANNGSNGPVNMDFHNSIINRIVWLSTFGDARNNGGHDSDYNVYLTDNSRGAFVSHSSSGRTFNNIGSWQGWTSDPCSNCTRDPNSRQSRSTDEWVQTANNDDSWPPPYDYDLKAGAQAIDLGLPSLGVPLDIDLVTRVGRPDAGAWEREGASGPAACADGVDNDGDGQVDLADSNCTSPTDVSESQCGDNVAEGTAEVCDGTDLAGETCASQGFTGGTLACQPTCAGFDTSACTSNENPAAPSNYRRGKTRP